MLERMQVYRCERCGAGVVILRGADGHLNCCGAAMTLHQSTAIEPEEFLTPPPMEHNLSMPVKTVLRMIQTRHAEHTWYFGVKAVKNPIDAWVYQEIIHEIRPDIIIEIGNAYGGGTLHLAHLLDLLGHGKVIGVDLQHQTIAPGIERHPRITFITGDACESILRVKALIAPGDTVLVIEDSAHTYANTLNVLRTYSPLVTPGSYLIVEDSHCHHGVDTGPSPGPYEAIETFLRENDCFKSDRARENFFITFNPKGYLKRIR